MKKSFSEIIKIVKNKGFVEDCPNRDFWVFFKSPFIIRVYPFGKVKSWRVDKEYTVFGKIKR